MATLLFAKLRSTDLVAVVALAAKRIAVIKPLVVWTTSPVAEFSETSWPVAVRVASSVTLPVAFKITSPEVELMALLTSSVPVTVISAALPLVEPSSTKPLAEPTVRSTVTVGAKFAPAVVVALTLETASAMIRFWLLLKRTLLTAAPVLPAAKVFTVLVALARVKLPPAPIRANWLALISTPPVEVCVTEPVDSMPTLPVPAFTCAFRVIVLAAPPSSNTILPPCVDTPATLFFVIKFSLMVSTV